MVKHKFFKLINFSKKTIEYKKISICYGEKKVAHLNDILLGIVKEIGAKYNFEVVNFDINRSISAKNNDISSVRRNKILIKINKDKNDVILSKAFEQSLCSIYIFDVSGRKNSVIIFYKTETDLLSRLLGKRYKDCLTSFAEFAFAVFEKKLLPELILLHESNAPQVRDLLVFSSNHIAVEVLESVNKDFHKKNNIQKIANFIKLKIQTVLNLQGENISTFNLVSSNLLSLIFLLQKISRSVNDKVEYRKLSLLFELMLKEENIRIAMQSLQVFDSKKFKNIVELIKNKSIDFGNPKAIGSFDKTRNRFVSERVKYLNFYTASKLILRYNSVSIYVECDSEFKVESLVRHVKQAIECFTQTGCDNLDLSRWRLFQVKYEEMEVYPAIFFWNSYFTKFRLIFQSEILVDLSFLLCKDFIFFISKELEKKFLIIEKVELTREDEM